MSEPPLKAGAAEAYLTGKPIDEANLNEAARLAMSICEPTPDQRGDVAYKTAMCGEMTRRALQAARARAGNDHGRRRCRRRTVSFKLNGKGVKVAVEPRELLIDMLREKLAHTGPHIGCETSHCGACTVDMDGMSLKPARF